MRVLITGGSGFIGTNLVAYYHDRGNDVLNLDVVSPRNEDQRGRWRAVDICDAGAVSAAFESFQPDYVLHMAARTDLHGANVADYAANTDGVRNVLRAAAQVKSLRRIVLASSMLVCRLGYTPRHDEDWCPSTAYGASKVEGERIVRAESPAGLPWVMVRPTSIWGPWFGVPYKSFFTAVQRGRYFHPRGRVIQRSYGFVGNAVHQIDSLLRQPAAQVGGKVFYLADYTPVDIRAWAELIRNAFGAPPVMEVPFGILSLAARAGDLFKRCGMENPPLTSFRLNNLVTNAVYPTAELRDLTGPSPYGLDEAVRITVSWMQRQNSFGQLRLQH